MALPEETMSFEKRLLAEAIMRVQALRDKAKDGSAPREFYQTMDEVLCAMGGAIDELRMMHARNADLSLLWGKALNRIEILEASVAMLLALHSGGTNEFNRPSSLPEGAKAPQKEGNR